jgi:hypothetical protein
VEHDVGDLSRGERDGRVGAAHEIDCR